MERPSKGGGKFNLVQGTRFPLPFVHILKTKTLPAPLSLEPKGGMCHSMHGRMGRKWSKLTLINGEQANENCTKKIVQLMCRAILRPRRDQMIQITEHIIQTSPYLIQSQMFTSGCQGWVHVQE